MDVVDHELDVAGRPDEAHDERHREPDAAQDGEPDGALPLGGPQHVLEQVERQEVERADPAAHDADQHYQPHHLRLDAEEIGVEELTPFEPWSSPHD